MGTVPRRPLHLFNFHLAALDRSEWFWDKDSFPPKKKMVQIHICKDQQFYHYKVIKV